MSVPAVSRSADFERIWQIPRRIRPDSAPTPDFRTPAGIAAGVALNGAQQVGLNELHWYHGLFAAFPVGKGKTILSYLAALAARKPNGAPIRRPWLLLPANLARGKNGKPSKTDKEFRRLAQHWQQPQPFPIIHTYEELTQEANVRIFEQGEPDMLICDECSKLRRIDDGSAPIRIDRYVRAKRAQEIQQGTGFGSELQVVVMTGTIGRGSLKDFAHLLRWCLGDSSPLPLVNGTLWQWCQALDDDRNVDAGRWAPGVLYSFAPEARELMASISADATWDIGKENEALDMVRRGVFQRMSDTPGCVIYTEDSCDQPLSISFHVPDLCNDIENFFREYVRRWVTPDGFEYGSALDAYRNSGDAGCGFWGVWDPRAPQEWLTARREAMQVVKDEIEASRHGRTPLDTENAVFKALPDNPAIQKWLSVRKDFTPNPVATWFTASLVNEVSKLVANWEAAGYKVIVWTFDVPVAQALMSVTGLPYYGSQGHRHTVDLKPTDDSIEDNDHMYHKDQNGLDGYGAPKSSIIASVAANQYGRNLQRYCVSIWVGWDASTIDIEQRLGRQHRQGQMRPVHNQIVATCGETLDAFAKARSESRTVKNLQGHVQKLWQAEVLYDTIDSRKLQASPSRFARRLPNV